MTVKVSKPAINIREGLADLHKPSGIAGEAMLKAETQQEQFNLISAGRRRMNLNGAMNVFQKGNATAIGSSVFGAADRYLTQNDVAGTLSLTEDADVPEEGGFQSSFKIACTATETLNTTTTNLILIHRLEGQDSQCTNFGKPTASSLTLSFWIKSNRAGDFSVNFENEHPSGGSSGDDRGYQVKQTLNEADTWEYKVVTIEGDSVAGKGFQNSSLKGLCFEISLSKAGSTFSGGTPKPYWHNLANNERSTHNTHLFGDSTANYWKITGVQLELGKIATPFEHRSYGEELAGCQRYLYVINGPTAGDRVGSAFISAARTAIVNINFPVLMRGKPSLLGTVSPLTINDAAAADASTSIALHSTQPHFASLVVTTGSDMNTYRGAQAYFTNTADNKIIWQAEI